jgi:hypothetical protein
MICIQLNSFRGDLNGYNNSASPVSMMADGFWFRVSGFVLTGKLFP